MYYQKFKVGEKVDYMSNGNWVDGVVEVALEEMIKCDPSKPNSESALKWICIESDDYSRHGQMNGNKREQLHTFYENLSQFVV